MKRDRPAMARPFKLIPPFRFSIVELDVYRGAYPTLKNFPFLKTLALKTIISLTPVSPEILSLSTLIMLRGNISIHLQERPIPDLEDFCFCEGVQLLHYMGNLHALVRALPSPLFRHIEEADRPLLSLQSRSQRTRSHSAQTTCGRSPSAHLPCFWPPG